MLIYRRQLDELTQYRNESNPVVSLYLNVKPPRNFAAEMNSLLHNTTLHLQEENRFDKKRINAIKKVMDRIQEYVRYNFQRQKNTSLTAIFADADGLWQEYRLPVGLPSRLTVEPDPYVRPISILLEEFERFLVLVADSRSARLFSLYLEDFEEIPDLFMREEIPDRVRTNLSRRAGGGPYSPIGVSGATGSRRVENHVEDHIHKHLKNVADITFNEFRKKNFNRLIIGTPDDKIRPWLKEHLHSYLRKRLAGEFNAQPETSDHELRLMALEKVAECERKQENELIDKLFEKSSPDGLGVLGVEPVIKALHMSQVHTLVVKNDFETGGFLCSSDHILSTHDQTCPICGDQMHPMDDIVDEIVEEALLQNAEIEHVFTDHEGFRKYNIGAILRFTVANR